MTAVRSTLVSLVVPVLVASGAVSALLAVTTAPLHAQLQAQQPAGDFPWWAYGLFALLALGGLYGLRRYGLGRLGLRDRLALELVRTDRLRELDRARSRFFANVSHEFRTPLTLTLGPLDDLLAGRHGALSPTMREQVDLAHRNATRVLELIEQILEVARLEAGEMPLRARRLDLGALAAEAARTFIPLAERKALRLEVHVPTDRIDVYADPEHLWKVLSNLLSNALKFTPNGGTVRLTVERDPELARVRVRDSGPGIPARELARIFDRFHRVDVGAARDHPGTGIGLALARELVDLHGGAIEVESEEGFGSTFTVSLRRGRAHLSSDQIVEDEPDETGVRAFGGVELRGVRSEEKPSAATVVPKAGAGDDVPAEEDVTTVLVVDDHPDVRAYLKRHLAPRYRVLEAPDGERALEMARRLLPDLVLSDVMMPGLDGYALCRALKADAETDFIPVILLTARASAEDRVEGLEGRADDYLTKPFDARELLARVENLIESRQRLRERMATGLTLHPSAVDVEPDEARFLERVRSAIEESLGDESFSVERLAREVSHSRGHLHRRLRALVDESPSDVIRRMRLERAAQLLEVDGDPIGSIAYAVGFKSVAHFSNRFRDQFGVRPSAYRAERTARGARPTRVGAGGT